MEGGKYPNCLLCMLPSCSNLSQKEVYFYNMENKNFFNRQIISLASLSSFFGCSGSSLLCAGFLPVQRAEAALRCGARASPCGGFSGAQAPGTQASGAAACRSVVAARGLQASCGAWAQPLRSTWNLPAPGIKSMSSSLAASFLTTAPPGKLGKEAF